MEHRFAGRHEPPPPNEGDISGWVPVIREVSTTARFPKEAVVYRGIAPAHAAQDRNAPPAITNRKP